MLVDGYDEVQGSGNVYERFALNSCWEDVKVIFTSRAVYLDQHKLLEDFALPELQTESFKLQQDSLTQTYLVGFSVKERESFARKFVETQQSTTMQHKK